MEAGEGLKPKAAGSEVRTPRAFGIAGAAVMASGFLLLGSCVPKEKVTVVRPVNKSIHIDATSPSGRLDQCLDAAHAAWRRVMESPGDSAALTDYNFAVSRTVTAIKDAGVAPWKAPVRAGGRTLVWKRDARPDWDPAKYEIIPADTLEITGKLVDEREIKAGLGAPLVARRLADQVHEFAPTPHFYYAATAVLRFEGNRCEIAFEDPLETETVNAGGRAFPLAADYTAPLAMMVVEMHPRSLGIPRLLRPEKYASTARIARLETYDPNKRVILFVHGLMDSPATWFPLMNHLRADEKIRKNYQFWFFSYPSGYPYPYSASILRRELDHAEHLYPIRKKMVVIGHSMGGCISRLLITDSERRIWDSMFEVPPEKMPIPPGHLHVLQSSTIFESRPEIGRVIFISTPHHGSDLAVNWIGRLGANLVKLPNDLMDLGKEEAGFERHPEGHLHLKRFPDSVDTLAPNNDFVLALKPLPVRKGVPCHSIIGDRGRGDSPNSSDGVVPYWSSHRTDVVSEKIVPSNHGAQRHPDTITEVRRILEQNLKDSP